MQRANAKGKCKGQRKRAKVKGNGQSKEKKKDFVEANKIRENHFRNPFSDITKFMTT
jgi:hypothetical protein